MSEVLKDLKFEAFLMECWPLWTQGLAIDEIAAKMDVNASAVFTAIQYLQEGTGVYRGGDCWSSEKAWEKAKEGWDSHPPWEDEAGCI